MQIDCHILSLPGENSLFHKRVRSQLRRQPVNIIESPGILGDLREARHQAYLKGTAEFVSFVDYDDEVHDGAYQSCLDLMSSHPGLIGCYTKHYKISATGKTLVSFPNWSPSLFIEEGFSRVFIVRRDIMLSVIQSHKDILPRVWGQDRCMLALCGLYGSFKQVDIIGYSYYQHAFSTSVRAFNQHGIARFEDNISSARDIIRLHT